MLKHFLNPPNWFTSASIFCSFYAMLLATGANGDPMAFYKAGLLIGFAGVFDMLDGRVARWTGGGSEFGVQLDSLADMMWFGVAPAILVYSWALHDLGAVGIGASFFFIVCAAFRLARFNVGTSDGAEAQHSIGLTTTMAGGTVAALVMFHAAIGRTSVQNPVGPLLMTLLLAFLMVSPVRFRVFKMRLSPAAKGGLALFFGCLIAVGVFYDISFIVAPMMVTYTAAGLIEGVVKLSTRRVSAHSSGAATLNAPVADDDSEEPDDDDEDDDDVDSSAKG